MYGTAKIIFLQVQKVSCFKKILTYTFALKTRLENNDAEKKFKANFMKDVNHIQQPEGVLKPTELKKKL